jgi:hypothetical protein
MAFGRPSTAGTRTASRAGSVRLVAAVSLLALIGLIVTSRALITASSGAPWAPPVQQPSIDDIEPHAEVVGETPSVAPTVDTLARSPVAQGSASATNKTRGVLSEKYANGAANQAPPYPRVPLFGASRQDVIDGRAQTFVEPGAPKPQGSSAVCFDRNGDPTTVPLWVTSMFDTMPSEGHYAALAEAADANEWAALVAWVPERFMPPQPDGKNAAGQVMKAPTRGQDPEFYLKEYNATWHETANVKGLPYHYQLLHRNALAVCVRERLHLSAVRCAPRTGLPPALIHHCPCRKCREPASHATPAVGKIPGWTAETAHVPLLVPKALVAKTNFLQRKARPIPGISKRGADVAAIVAKHKPDDGPCVEAYSAPWLADRAAVPQFEYEGYETDLDGILKTQADDDGIVLIAMFNKFWLDHLHNFYFSMVRRGRIRNIVIATLDPDALSLCRENRMPCFDATDFAEREPDMEEGGEGYKKGHTRKVTEAMSWIKPRLAIAVIERGFGFFMVDLDMAWNSWAMKDVLDLGTDLTHQCDSDSSTSINSGYYLARPSARTWMFFSNLMLFRPDENSDQTAMKLYARYDHTHGVTHACLDKWLFNMKCNYKVKNSVKAGPNGEETFEWTPFDRDRSKFTWKILHATCINGAHAKLLYLRTVNAWFLDDLDSMTNKAGGYCLRLPDGSTTQGNTAKTKHSEKYTTATDDRYLQKLH